MSRRVKVIHQENCGVSVARNATLEAIKGKYVCFVDADDYIEKDYIKDLYIALIKHSADLSICNYYKESDNTKRIAYNFEDTVFCNNRSIMKFINKYNKKGPLFMVEVWARLFKASIIKENNIHFPVGIKHSEDRAFSYTYLIYVKRLAVVSKALYIHTNSDVSVHNKFYTSDTSENAKLLIDEFCKIAKNSPNKLHKRLCRQFIAELSYSVILQSAKFKKNDNNSKYRKLLYKNIFPLLLSKRAFLYKIKIIFMMVNERVWHSHA